MNHDRRVFDALFECSDDPWGFRSHWYEARKRALTLACLPSERYESAYEPGCANGELAAALAPRCGRLLVSDVAERAVELARVRLLEFSHVTAIRSETPHEWPAQKFDLIVVSELAYFLDAQALEPLALRVRASLCEGGTVLACHWRHRIEGGTFDGDFAHRQLHRVLALPRLCRLIEPDLRIDVWSLDGRSVAQRGGLV